MQRIIFTTLLILVYSTLLAQNHFITGKILDSLSHETLKGANVIALHLPDSSIQGAASGDGGIFKIDNLRRGNYVLKVSFVGYKTFNRRFEILRASVDFGNIFLSASGVETDEVEITAKVIPVIQKEDTTEYSSDAYKINKDASAEDLVAKMPGVVVKDGKVEAQGEQVKKVLVDGKQFFGDDPSAALRNMPAEIIERIQVFDQQSEQSQFTGFDDGNTSKTMNIITRTRFRDGTFGRLTAGYGNLEKYLTGGNINYFNEDQRLTVLGQLNNINEQNFSSEDLAGVMSGGRSGGFRRPGGGMSGGGFRGRESSNFLVDARNGLTTTKSFGINYSDKLWEGLQISGSYFFNFTNSDAKTSLERNYFAASDAGDKYAEYNNSISENTNHRFNMRFDYDIDSSSSILFRPRITYQLNNGISALSGFTSSQNNMINSVNNLFSSDLTALDASAQLLYRYRFSTKGRTLSMNINTSFKNNDGDNNLFAESIFYNDLITSDTLDQRSELITDGRGGSANLSYTEPVGENSMILFNASYSLNEEESDKNTFNLFENKYSLDSTLSNVYRKTYASQSVGAGYRYNLEGMFITANINYSISKLNNDQTFPAASEINKTFYSLLPSLMIRYRISKDSDLRFFYRTYNNDPSVDKLQFVLDNSNPVQLSIGNPDLRQDFRQTLFIRYSTVNPSDMSSFFVLFSGSLTNDYIGNRTIIAQSDTTVLGSVALSRGAQLQIPENMDSYFNFRSFVSYGLPVEFIRSNVNMNLNVNYIRTPGIINDYKSYSNSSIYGFGLVLSSNISEYVDYTISSSSSFNIIANAFNNSSRTEYFNQNTGLKLYLRLPYDFVIQSDFTHKYEGGLPESYDPNSYVWNLSIGKKILNNLGELRVSAYDLLERTTNISRTTSDIYIEDSSSNVIGRFFLFSFIYTLRAF